MGRGLNHPTLGSKDAVVTILEVTNVHSRFAATLMPPIKRALQARYRGQVRFVWMTSLKTFAEDAMPASRAAMAAHVQGQFHAMNDLLLMHQKELSVKQFVEFAEMLSMDVPAFKADMARPGLTRFIKRSDAWARALGAGYGPTYFVNGVAVRGEPTEARLGMMIDKELTAARELLHNGVSPSKVSDHRVRALNSRYAELVLDGADPKPVTSNDDSDEKVWRVPVSDADPKLGPETAPVTIVAFTDYECAGCAESSSALLAVAAAEPDVRLVVKQRPRVGSRYARVLAYAALAAQEQGAFWPMHRQLTSAGFVPSKRLVIEWAAELGLDGALFERSLLDAIRRYEPRLRRDELLAERVGAYTPPTLFINGRKLAGAVTAEQLHDEVATARRAAAAEQGPGIYERLIADGAQRDLLSSRRRNFRHPNSAAAVTLTVFTPPYCGGASGLEREISRLQQLHRDELRVVISNDVATGRRYGMTRAPGIFVNGRRYIGSVSGAAALETLITQAMPIR